MIGVAVRRRQHGRHAREVVRQALLDGDGDLDRGPGQVDREAGDGTRARAAQPELVGREGRAHRVALPAAACDVLALDQRAGILEQHVAEVVHQAADIARVDRRRGRGRFLVERAGQRRLRVRLAVDGDDLAGDREPGDLRREDRPGGGLDEVDVGGRRGPRQVDRRSGPARARELDGRLAVDGDVEVDALGGLGRLERRGQDLLGVGQRRAWRGAVAGADQQGDGSDEAQGSGRWADHVAPRGWQWRPVIGSMTRDRVAV